MVYKDVGLLLVYNKGYELLTIWSVRWSVQGADPSAHYQPFFGRFGPIKIGVCTLVQIRGEIIYKLYRGTDFTIYRHRKSGVNYKWSDRS